MRAPSIDEDHKFSKRSLKPRCERKTMCEAADGGLRVCASKQAVMAGRRCRNTVRAWRASVDRAGMQAAAR
jgi:hypothetical protein